MVYACNVLLGITQFLLIAYILYSEVLNKSSACFLWATLFIMFGIPHLLTAVTLNVDFETDTIFKVSVFVCLFCILYLITRKHNGNAFIELHDSFHWELTSFDVRESVFERLCFVVFFVSMILYLLNVIKNQGGILNTSWATRDSGSENYVNLEGLLSRIVFMFSGFSLYFFLTKRKVKSVAVVLLFVFLVFVTRNRVQILPVLLFPITLFLLRIKRIQLKHIVFAGLSAIAVIYIVYGIRAFRWLGTLSNAFKSFSFKYLNSKIMEFITSKNGELGLRQDFYFFVQENNMFEGFNRGYTYIRMLLVFLPSHWTLGIKPQSFDLYMGQAIGMVAGGSTHPTLFGDCFGNLNWAGIILGAFWAFFANAVDHLISRQKDSFSKIMIYYMAGYSYVVMGRGSVYNGFQVLAWGALFLSLLNLFFSKLKYVIISFQYRIDSIIQEINTEKSQ